MNWEQVDNLLKEQITNNSDIHSGYIKIKQTLTDYGLPTIEINIDELKKEFNNWLSEVIKKESLPKNIKSVYFGITTMKFPKIDNGKEKTTVYISGSQLSPEQDVDWACDTEYFPCNRYILLTEFNKIDIIIKNNKNLDANYKVLLFNGLLNLLVINSLNDFKDRLLTYHDKKFGLFKTTKKRDSLSIGTGFDSGDLYLLNKIKNQ